MLDRTLEYDEFRQAASLQERLELLKSLKEGTTKRTLLDIKAEFKQSPVSFSETAVRNLLQICHIPASYYTRVPEDLKEEILDEGVNYALSEASLKEVYVYKTSSNMTHFISPYPALDIYDEVKSALAQDTLLSMSGDPLQDKFTLNFKVSSDLELDSESPLFVKLSMELSPLNLHGGKARFGIYRLVCKNGAMAPVKNLADSFTIKPSIFDNSDFRKIFASAQGSCSVYEDFYKKFYGTLKATPLPQPPVEILSDLTEAKKMSKSLAKATADILQMVSDGTSANLPLPKSVKTLYDFENVLTFSARAFPPKTRNSMELSITQALAGLIPS